MHTYSQLFAVLAFGEAFALAATTKAKTCTTSLPLKYAAPSLASGYVARLVATGLTTPRSIKFDTNGALLVVESGVGVTALTLDESNPSCVIEKSRKVVVANNALNHGLELSPAGTTLYASDTGSAYAWSYSASKQSATSRKTIINNMTNSDHTTRSLLLPKSAPGVLVVSRGSNSNLDPTSENISSGTAQVKAFNITNIKQPLGFTSSGKLLGWGLRNDVGLAEEPKGGGIYTVENSADQITRNGVDIHNTNPSEEMNFLGYLNGKSSPNQGRNFGYPECFTAWSPSTIPAFKGKVGQQFAIGTIGPGNNDKLCSNKYKQQAALGFHPHMAPLSILFNPSGDTGWVTFHGSWDSTVPVGMYSPPLESQ